MRLFVGIELGEPFVASVGAAVVRLRAAIEQSCRGLAVRWADSANLHLTLVFIGEIAEDASPAVNTALASPFSVAPFDLAGGRFGVFPPGGPPKIIWMGVSSGLDALSALHAEVTRRLAVLGHAPEARPYFPHLTVGRVKDGRGPVAVKVRDVAGRATGTDATSRIGAVTLFRSHLSGHGSTYEALMRVPLRG